MKKKSPAKSPVGSLSVQPHGGALRHGAKPGTNRGGSGRPKDEIRAMLRGKLDAVVASLAKRHAAGELSSADELRYADFLAKYGIGTQQESEVTTIQAPKAVVLKRA